uniref:Large ribosomal subunit protein uL4c n=1 Tax=Riquetophycus sp. TaxID=1897556 RepID=A0A1C9C8G8_9FLOR|nr:ribosomal protein L4 [Riquetophycus sp.]
MEKKLQYSVMSENKQNTKNITLKVNDNKSMYIIHRAFISQMQSDRKRNANTKNRSHVRGGGKKPWKQKGTGRARAGSSRSPLWKGGGVIFGPKTRKYNHKINRKEKQLALKTLLYNRFNKTFIVENLIDSINQPNSQAMLKWLNNIGINTKIDNQILIIVLKKTNNLYLSTRNLANIELIHADQLNILAILKANTLIITPDAIDKINEVYNA